MTKIIEIQRQIEITNQTTYFVPFETSEYEISS